MLLNTAHYAIIKKREVLHEAFVKYPYDYELSQRYVESELGISFSSYDEFKDFLNAATIEFKEFDKFIAETGGFGRK